MKKLQQELQCQRYNAEAAKTAVEQKAKKREMELKEEVHQQAESLRRLEKELNDSKNRMQQEINQVCLTVTHYGSNMVQLGPYTYHSFHLYMYVALLCLEMDSNFSMPSKAWSC